MNMEENTLQRVRDRLREALSVPYVQKAVLLGIAALSGFLSARGLVFGKYAPFAAAAAEKKEEDVLFCAGSLYLAGEIRDYFRRNEDERRGNDDPV